MAATSSSTNSQAPSVFAFSIVVHSPVFMLPSLSVASVRKAPSLPSIRQKNSLPGLRHGRDVALVAVVLANDDLSLSLVSQFHDPPAISKGQRKGFFDQDVHASLDRLGAVLDAGRSGRGDDCNVRFDDLGRFFHGTKC